eukprot:scpid82843/ scgid14660/ 
MLKPESKKRLEVYENNMDHDAEYHMGQALLALNFSKSGAKWVPATVVSVLSPMTYQVSVGDAVWKRHRNQLQPRSIPGIARTEFSKPQPATPGPSDPTLSVDPLRLPVAEEPAVSTSHSTADTSEATEVSSATQATAGSTQEVRRSSRTINHPCKYRD